MPASGGIAPARRRLDPALAELFSQVAVPVAGLDTAGAFLGPWRLMALDGTEWDVPDSKANRAFLGSRAGAAGPAAFPKVRVVTVSECGSHAAVLAAMGPAAGGKGSGEQALARTLYPDLEEDWLVIADRNFTAGRTGARRRVPGRRCCGGSDRASCCRRWSCCPMARTGRCWSSQESAPPGANC